MVYTEEEARRIIVQAGHRLVKKGLTARTWGNISARISDTHFAITPSGRAYETLQPEDIVVVKIEDCSWEGDQKPSSEKGIHADVYRTRPGVNFVIHTHQAAASAWSILGKHISAADLMISQDNGAEQIRTLRGLRAVRHKKTPGECGPDDAGVSGEQGRADAKPWSPLHGPG